MRITLHGIRMGVDSSRFQRILLRRAFFQKTGVLMGVESFLYHKELSLYHMIQGILLIPYGTRNPSYTIKSYPYTIWYKESFLYHKELSLYHMVQGILLIPFPPRPHLLEECPTKSYPLK